MDRNARTKSDCLGTKRLRGNMSPSFCFRPLPSPPTFLHPSRCSLSGFFFSIKSAKYSSCFPFEGYLTFPLMHLSALMFLSLLCSGIFYIPVREKMSTKYKMLLSCCLAALRKNLCLLSREAGPGVKYLFRRKTCRVLLFFLNVFFPDI